MRLCKPILLLCLLILALSACAQPKQPAATTPTAAVDSVTTQSSVPEMCDGYRLAGAATMEELEALFVTDRDFVGDHYYYPKALPEGAEFSGAGIREAYFELTFTIPCNRTFNTLSYCLWRNTDPQVRLDHLTQTIAGTETLTYAGRTYVYNAQRGVDLADDTGDPLYAHRFTFATDDGACMEVTVTAAIPKEEALAYVDVVRVDME